MKDVIVITGASSGFGALAARALARAGHTVYASMRETTGRNSPQVAETQKYAAEHAVDLHTIELDVASEASADAAIEEIVTALGHARPPIRLGYTSIPGDRTHPVRSLRPGTLVSR